MSFLNLRLPGPVTTQSERESVRPCRPVAGVGKTRRVMIVGVETAVKALSEAHGDLAVGGGRVVCTAVLRADPAMSGDDLLLATAIARLKAPDDILLVFPDNGWSLLEPAVAALRQLPAALHVVLPALPASGGPARLNTIQLVSRPLRPAALRLKRGFDIVASATALLLLGPLLLLIAAAIKLDSRGPVVFRQRRYGFNQQPFRILKFRSMRSMEDTATLRQVTANDDRVTRVGRILRRTSLDELPQLVNVLKGDMSLIGPRPHALAHDQQFARLVERYGRRHAVRPGITGWAQVRGFRGETDTPDKIEGRVRHDLHYVDNWSPWLDVSILFRTLFSRRTFQNAK